MSELRPYQPSSKAPLSGGARFIRGFKRIGFATGSVALIGGLAITIVVSINQQNSAESRYTQATCIADRVRNNWPIKMKSYDLTKIDFSESGCPTGPFYYESLSSVLAFAKQKPAPLEYAIEPLSWGIAISVCSALFLYGGFWLVGWLCAGFTRD
jgi:hypothetical protein